MNPTNLISALRLSLDLWKKENQVKNVQAIIKRGTILYEKLQALPTPSSVSATGWPACKGITIKPSTSSRTVTAV